MYNVLLILLNRPFVSEGRLDSSSPSQTVAAKAFAPCAAAATRIVQLVLAYDRAFSIKRAPYLISYATYVSATIHVRIAAQRAPRSDAHTSLETCLSVLEKNGETNWAVRKARKVIIDLAEKMSVALEKRRVISPRSAEKIPPGPQSVDAEQMPQNDYANELGLTFPDLDMEAIVQSFMQEPPEQVRMEEAGFGGPMQNHAGTAYAQPQYINSGNLGGNNSLVAWNTGRSNMLQIDEFLPDDALFGFNRAGLDGYMWNSPSWDQRT